MAGEPTDEVPLEAGSDPAPRRTRIIYVVFGLVVLGAITAGLMLAGGGTDEAARPASPTTTVAPPSAKEQCIDRYARDILNASQRGTTQDGYLYIGRLYGLSTPEGAWVAQTYVAYSSAIYQVGGSAALKQLNDQIVARCTQATAGR